MYFDTKMFASGCKTWFQLLREPIMGDLILGMQGAHTEKADPVFTALKNAWAWKIDSAFDLFFKPIVLLVVLMVSLAGTLVKIAVMLCLLPLWLLITSLFSIHRGLPAYEQTWVSVHD